MIKTNWIKKELYFESYEIFILDVFFYNFFEFFLIYFEFLLIKNIFKNRFLSVH